MLLKNPVRSDHDNDGIDDLNDLDDDNDGIYDLLSVSMAARDRPVRPRQRRHPGADDWDDDNDGILEGPVDYDALEALGLTPQRVHRSLRDEHNHPPGTGQQVGQYYVVGPESLRPRQRRRPGRGQRWRWSGPVRRGRRQRRAHRPVRMAVRPRRRWCAGLLRRGRRQRRLLDVDDAHPYDASITDDISTTASPVVRPGTWTFNEYRLYSGWRQLRRVGKEPLNAAGATASGFTRDWEPGTAWASQGTPSFTTIVDGDLDGDGIPNFIDPTTTTTEPRTAPIRRRRRRRHPSTWDPDDDNDGILDVRERGHQWRPTGRHDRHPQRRGHPISSPTSGASYVSGSNVATQGGTGSGLTLDVTPPVARSPAPPSTTQGTGTGGRQHCHHRWQLQPTVTGRVSSATDIPGGDGDDGTIDCEVDYDQGLTTTACVPSTRTTTRSTTG